MMGIGADGALQPRCCVRVREGLRSRRRLQLSSTDLIARPPSCREAGLVQPRSALPCSSLATTWTAVALNEANTSFPSSRCSLVERLGRHVRDEAEPAVEPILRKKPIEDMLTILAGNTFLALVATPGCTRSIVTFSGRIQQ